MEFAYVEKITRLIYEYFDSLKPIYVVSGDTDFETKKAILYYEKSLDLLKELSPNSLKTVHIKGRLDQIPQNLVDKIDFYMYQSGHNVMYPEMPYYLAQNFYNNYPTKPIINSEPCYEQMGYSRRMYGRFTQFDVRKAAWMSVLSGGCAGICYGAHGIWSWHSKNSVFGNDIGEAFDSPIPWQDALMLPGAWDYGYMLNLLDLYKVKELVPTNLLLNNTQDIRMAYTSDKSILFIYVPRNTVVKIDANIKNYDVKIIDLQTKNIATANVLIKDNQSFIQPHTFLKDVLIIGKAKT